MNFELDFTNSLNVPYNLLLEGVAYAKNKRIKSITLRQEGFEIPDIDLSALSLYPDIETLNFSVRIGKNSNIDGIYILKHLKRLSYAGYDSIPLDHTQLTSITYLYTHFSKNHLEGNAMFQNLNDLETLHLWHLNHTDCVFLSEINTLKNLELTHGSLPTIEGLQYLPNLEHLKLDYLPKLKDINAINQCDKISSLTILRSKNIYLESLKESNIKNLFIDKVDNLEFIKDFNSLKNLYIYDDIKNGDLNPIFYNNSLKKIEIYSYKKKYNRTEEQIKEFLNKK
ncbi:hypothetical protein [Capnocytophaga gingivalis]|uniref:Leucine Rich Repeat protein n=1 Tax=Capnocytophaga gingivalis TaxID=1017 RepID=A0ABU5Z4U4_9FLAO|nr:hypothetical protein [Capnocytophaga gingivalis]MEB3073984.1 hypothetical protein [Capnocytophaga gingivalis]